MTKSEILALPIANLNTLAAGAVMGECYHEYLDHDKSDHIECLRCGQSRFYHQEPQEYAQSILAAWRVVEKMFAAGHDMSLCRREAGWYCDFRKRGDTAPNEYSWVDRQASAPEAICRAALLIRELRGVEKAL